MFTLCVQDLLRNADEKYAAEPGVVKQKCWPSKTIKLYNNSKYFVELDVSDKRGTFLRRMSLGAMGADAGLEFEHGDNTGVQTIKILPGNVKKIRVGTWSYIITAYMNGRILFKNRVYSTRHYPCFFDRHYGEAAVGIVRPVPAEHFIKPPSPPAQVEEEPKRRRWFFLFLF